jgi:hypothetical protein
MDEEEKKKIIQQKIHIKKLCDERSIIPLISGTDYYQYVEKHTGLTLDSFNYEEIIKKLDVPIDPARLRAIQAAREVKSIHSTFA